MIEHLEILNVEKDTFRIASDYDLDIYMSELGLGTNTVLQREFLEIAQENVLTSPDRIVEKVFSYSPNLNFGSRFTDGSYSIYYSALEIETAIAEKIHHFKKNVNSKKYVAYFRLLNCKFNGDVKDLLPLRNDLSFLTSAVEESYAACRELAKEAIEHNLDALITPSARNSEGACLPVFNLKPLSNPSFGSVVIFNYDPLTFEVTVSRD